jgi:hypothetical protein
MSPRSLLRLARIGHLHFTFAFAGSWYSRKKGLVVWTEVDATFLSGENRELSSI